MRTAAPRPPPERSSWTPGGRSPGPPLANHGCHPLAALCAARGAAPFVDFNQRVVEGIVMETAVRTVFRPELVEPVSPSTAPVPVRTLTVTATYELSEAGRKALLLAGGDG